MGFCSRYGSIYFQLDILDHRSLPISWIFISFLFYLRQNYVGCNGLCQPIPLSIFFFARSNTISLFLCSDSNTAVLPSALTTRGNQISGYHNEDGVYCTVINLEVLLLDGWLCQRYANALFRLQPPSHNNLLTPYSIFAYMLVIFCASAKLSRNQESAKRDKERG